MPDVNVNRGSTAKLDRVEGELRVGNNARIVSADGRQVTVTEGAYFEGNAELDCDFECDSLRVDRGRLTVKGDLTVHKGLDVAHTVSAEGAIHAGDIDVGGKMVARSVSCVGAIRVGGFVDIKETMEARSVEVGGKLGVSGAVKLEDLGVGGKADVGGGRITGHAQVGGLFASTGPLEFGELLVYGKCSLPAGCKGSRISTHGKLSVAGDLSAEEVLVNGNLDVSGSLVVKGTLEANGSCELRGELNGRDLRVGGRFKALKAVLSNQADIAGELETYQGLKANAIMIKSGTRCNGVLVGERIELGKSWLVIANWGMQWLGQTIVARGIGRMTTAGDIFGTEVILGPNSKCGKIFANRVELSDGCVVDDVTYTDEFRRTEGRVFLVHAAQKVPQLPPFPL